MYQHRECDLLLERFRDAQPVSLEGKSMRVREVLSCVHARLFDTALNVKTIKIQCRISDNNISCIFKHETGVSIREYVERLRLEAAAELLRSKSCPVGDIAWCVGYANLQTFYGAFARRYNCRPAVFRRRTEKEESSASIERQ